MAKQRRTATVEDIAETPIRGDLFSVERLEEFAVYLSDHLKVVRGSKIRRPLLKRLKDSDQKLLHCYTELSVALREKETITPAAEWFVDNFHIIEDQVREIKNDLPKSYYNELPKLGVGDLVGYPRIYALALSLIAHTDSRLDAETIRRFVKSFQVKSSLTIGELWAVPITLRLALVENVRRVALRVAWDRSQRLQGDAIADEVFELAGKGKGALQKTLDKISGLFGPSADKDYALISQLVKRFRDQEPEVWPAMERVEKCLAQQNLNIEAIVNIEHQIQAANLVTIANIITSMRLLSNLNWQTFFESVSVLDRILEKDPVGAYAQMDFKTRDEYRHFIERASRKSKLTELEIAEKAVSLAQEAQNKNPQDHRKSHVGYYFRERGIEKLAVHCGYKVPWTTQWRYRISIRPTVFYIASLMLLTAALMVGPIYYALENGAALGLLIVAGLLLFIPCGDLAVSIFNFLLTNIVHPKPLPKMDYSKGVPDEARTLVVVPCLLSDIETIDSLLEKMEVHYLGNSDANIFFSLATDFKDAASEHTPMDQSLLERVQNGVRALNQKYDPLRAERFALFHRHRLWNSADEKWMGWERKRGKLEELNRLLRNGGKGSFAVVTLPEEILPTFKYVITLDADTHLGRDVASKLIATGMHPLNRPVFDEKQGRVVKGYGLIQPRISISLESSARSIFAKVFSGHTGIDPYTTAVSDIYQDLFLEGSFTGKGIYDIDAFEMSLRGKIPENTVLSHDLLEGLFARAALVTDIELLDDYPKTYRTFFLRQHRWTRGDWQIARWMFQANSLPLISRWKIYDNLRRSLVAVGLFLLFVAGWTLMPGSVFFWTALPIFIIAVPAFIHVANGILISPRGVPWSSNFWNVVGNARMNLAQFFLSLAFLVHQAAIQVDAIVRVFYRQMISKKDRLEWVTAADQEKITHRVNSLWQTPWIVETVLFVTLLLVASRGSLLVLATSLPFLLLWACYPWIAHVTSYRRKKEYDLQVQDKEFLELIARRIWHFFETFVTKEDNFLPPDNYQEDPEGVVAHRTSPTNIGLYTLAVVTAKDLGYLGTRVCLDRLNDTFLTLKRLETYKGHFYNWYDTQSLEPLYPKYISMVDSGNLAGYLLAVKQTCIELEDAPILGPRTLHALRLTLSIVENEADSISTRRQTSAAVSVAYVLKDIQEIQKNLFTSEPRKFTEWDLVARMLKNAIDDVHDSILTLEQENGERPYRHLKSWVEALLVQINDLQKDLELFAPWLSWVGEFSHEVITELDHVFIPSAMLVSYNAALVKIASMQHDSKDLDSGKNLPPRSALVELDHLEESLKRGRGHVLATLKQCQDIAAFCEMLFVNMDFEFLFDKDREVFSIGYNVIEGRHDNSFYDLLASEARLGSFIAIAKGDVDQKHWFRLGRQLVSVEGRRALISWSASMFEYLMPSLVMKDYDNTLLHETMHAVVERQISYGKKQKVPWGVSEAGYNARDLNFNYQYGPFGIPGLGLKRGLSHDLVISPYSTFLALEQNPKKSLRNLSELIKLRTLTRYGFYEALDFTPERVEEKQKFAVIRSFMAHHQGMSLVAINNLLNTSIMQKRFHSELRVKATQLLLQERVPQKVPLATPKAALIEWEFAGGESLQKSFTRQYDTAHMRSPRVQILSNGKYSLMLTTAGSGYAKWEGIAVTRWREDVTRDCWGSFVYVKDLTTNRVWSSCHQPMGVEPDKYAVTLSEEKVEYRRQDSDVRTKTE
ncbi:MAG: hypothetical protein J7501_12320, partial [Bdellovibrio sp.]|nr:hypothetical protein [Bdellovibrio sp.]